MALAGFTPAPLMGPLMRMAAASAAPMAMAAAPRGTRLPSPVRGGGEASRAGAGSC
jgi:hypothetical protein